MDGFLLTNAQAGFDFTSTLVDLVVQILLPVILGLIFHRFWGEWAIRNKRWFALFDKSVILMIVYNSFL
jgi:sodium/bile acid cotransporter 7